MWRRCWKRVEDGVDRQEESHQLGISLKSQKILWTRAGGQCSFPGCRQDLIMDGTETDDDSLVGDICHIVAEEPNGPRGDSDLTRDERNHHDNLILLCRVHHKMVDDQQDEYTAEVLHKIKDEHEARVRKALKPDVLKLRDDEVYASRVDEWASRVDLDGWTEWTSHLLVEEEPWMTAARDASLSDMREWLLSRVWPKRYPDVEAAFGNFRLVLDGLQEVFRCHAEPTDSADDMLKVRRFYKIPIWDPGLYDHLLGRYKYHLEMIADLALELTRAANYVCDRVRESIMPSFRLKEGALFVEPGLFLSLSGRTRPEYRDRERIPMPYPGLEPFRRIRSTRDVHFKWPDRRTP
jgi:hypothetical protein